MLGRILRRLVRRSIRAVAGRRVLALGVVVVVLLAAGGLMARSLIGATSLPDFGVPGPGGEPAATAAYFQGYAEYDARRIWDTISADELDAFSKRVGGLEGLQRQLDFTRQQGVKLEQAWYVGGRSLPDGTSYHFYLVRAQSPLTPGEVEYVPYTFVLDRAGKISRIL